MQNNTVLSWLILAFTQKQFYTPVAALGKIKKKNVSVPALLATLSIFEG
jgi:hypothetical protein